ncbi:unnamed protein product, partial [Ectocarpus sp. 12 AP-2014]
MLMSSLRCFYVRLRRTMLLAFADLPSSILLGHACASQQISSQQQRRCFRSTRPVVHPECPA